MGGNPWEPDIEIVGSSPGLVRTVAGWAAQVAAHLDVPLPDKLHVEVHDHPGTAWTAQGRVHLCRRPSGDVDLGPLPHELVHLLAGCSPSRFVSEGLAVHIDAGLSVGPPCWPCFHLAPDLWVVNLRRRGHEPPPLQRLVVEAPVVSVSEAASRSRSSVLAAWTLYVVAGSFVRFCWETMERSHFWDGYRAGALWRDLADLGSMEGRWLARLPVQLSPADAEMLLASSAEARRQWASRP